MKKLILLDGMNLLFRSYYATAATGISCATAKVSRPTPSTASFPPSSKSSKWNSPTSSSPSIRKVRRIVTSNSKNTKAPAKKPRSNCSTKFRSSKRYLDAAGIPRYEQETYEADDIIGHIVKHHKADYDHITILSNDRDLLQLIGPNVTQMVSRKGFSEVESVHPRFDAYHHGLSARSNARLQRLGRRYVRQHSRRSGHRR
ncbi:MAG: hypothetical protein MZU97_17570 [Bacillus subtilis]|nr:hypothetical protein [Bacillus subtilis]